MTDFDDDFYGDLDDDLNALSHYGVLRKSGRYPWGSGDNESERSPSFLDTVESLRRKGMTETEIARGLGITTTELRAKKSIANAEQKQANIAMAQRLKDKGYSNVAIGQRMGINESSVRSLLAPGQKDKADVLHTTSQMLRDQVAAKKYVDVGIGVELHIGVSKDKLATAVAILREEGYKLNYIKVPQLGTGKETTLKVLTAPNTPYSEVSKNRDKIKQITDFSDDRGRNYYSIQPPLSVDSRRIQVRYKEDGGGEADGVIYVRPGIEDLSIGTGRYSQVRIAVDGTHYLKGMAMYKDDLPDGVDLLFNTSKSSTGNKKDAMKSMTDDPENPFGSIVRQIIKKGPDGRDHVVSAMNIVGGKEGAGEEGGWETWSKALSSQVLSKQSPMLAKTQLDMTYERKADEFGTIMKLTNPAVRKRLLEAFADSADSSAVHLKAAALPRQGSHVILPIKSMKENEIYAPSNYNNGERVVLIRHPHGGIFEIPELIVNNRNPEAKKLLGKAKDAVGIHPKVAERLSGADFDGDTVLVIPNNNRKIKTAPALEGLKNFDPKSAYPPYDGMRTMDGGIYNASTRKVDYGNKRPSSRTKAFEMGDVSNLITDMTIRGANYQEIARAVRHSMVVIDAEKHNLNWTQSAIDNGIRQLKTKYQGKSNAGAKTLISRAKSRYDIPARKARSARQGGPIDKQTGEKVYVLTGETYVKNGKVVFRTQRSTKLAETKDAHTLSSGTPIEKIYADHSNRLKDLANKARLASINVKFTPYSTSARKVYADEVASLSSKLNIALRNAPLERQAQIIANASVAQKKHASPNMDASDIQKLKIIELNNARLRTGANKKRIDITDLEWDAIQAGAVTNSMLNQILTNANLEQVKQLAMPRKVETMTSIKQQRAKAMIDSGYYTLPEIASALGVSLSTLKRSIAD